MPTRCAAVGCTSGYDSNPEKMHFFSVPNDPEKIKAWQKACQRTDIVLTSKRAFCQNHFLPSDIVFKKQFFDKSGKLIQEITLKRPYLKKGAVPSVFPLTEFPLKIEEEEGIIYIQDNVEPEIEEQVPPEETKHQFTFEDLKQHDKTFVPAKWRTWTIPYNKSETVFFCKMLPELKNNKMTLINAIEITVSSDLKIAVSVMNRNLDVTSHGFDEVITDVEDLQRMFKYLDSKMICAGLKCEELELTTQSNLISRHNDCTLLLNKGRQCKPCQTMKYVLQKRLRRQAYNCNSEKTIVLTAPPAAKKLIDCLRRQRNDARREVKRQKYINIKLKQEVAESQKEIQKLSENDVNQILRNVTVHDNEKLIIEEILSVAKTKSPQGRKYSEDWIIQSLLLHMKSPSTYNHLRESKILPLPCTSTIRRYLAMIDSSCGFDENFLTMLKQSLDQQSPVNKHGILLFSNVGVGESLVDSATLEDEEVSQGLSDFDGEIVDKASNGKNSNHGLMFMYQPLNGVHSAHPLSVFTNNGPISGKSLAQLVLKAIVCIENCGAKVHGVVCDGVGSNQGFWKEIGVSGTLKNSKSHFSHPVDENRNVFVFCDVPHVIKSIRNCLEKNDLQTTADGNKIKWEHIRAMYNEDRKMPYPRCPEVTYEHIELNNLGRMQLDLATQIFSKSVAESLRFYAQQNSDLTDSDETAQFCEWMNNLWDALNRKESGLTVDSSDMQVLKQSLQKLDEWEKLKIQKKIPLSAFLTSQTALELRLTLNSMIGITEYLTEKFEFPCILSGFINQEAAEVCLQWVN